MDREIKREGEKKGEKKEKGGKGEKKKQKKEREKKNKSVDWLKTYINNLLYIFQSMGVPS